MRKRNWEPLSRVPPADAGWASGSSSAAVGARPGGRSAPVRQPRRRWVAAGGPNLPSEPGDTALAALDTASRQAPARATGASEPRSGGLSRRSAGPRPPPAGRPGRPEEAGRSPALARRLPQPHSPMEPQGGPAPPPFRRWRNRDQQRLQRFVDFGGTCSLSTRRVHGRAISVGELTVVFMTKVR